MFKDSQLYRIFESLRRAPFSVLMLDYDGTLAPFVRKRDQAVFYPGIARILDDIAACERTKTVVVSGRTLTELSALVDSQMEKRLELWGSHGWERRDAKGSYYIREADSRFLSGLSGAKTIAAGRGFSRYLEEKPRSIAFHWREIPESDQIELRNFVGNDIAKIASGHSLELREFDGGIEMRIPGCDKGDVVRSLMDESAPETLFAYLGDDQTDEDAFSALQGKGFGILAGASPRNTQAGYFLIVPNELLPFFETWKESAEGGTTSVG